MTKPTNKKEKYPYIPFRPHPLMDSRLRRLAKQTGSSIGSLIRECVAAHLPKLEKSV